MVLRYVRTDDSNMPVEPVLGCPDCCRSLDERELGRFTMGLRLSSDIPDADADADAGGGGGGGVPPVLSSSSESCITFRPAIVHC